jgi:hypothetical protein
MGLFASFADFFAHRGSRCFDDGLGKVKPYYRKVRKESRKGRKGI